MSKTTTHPESEDVLIVEDEENLAELFEHRINDEYNTTIATNAGNAIANLNVETNYVLLDRRLPGMSGDKVLEYIADQPFDVNVIIISAIDPDEKVIHEPYDEYITKTVDDGEIKDAMERVAVKNRFVELLGEYVKKAETLEMLESELNTPEQEDNVETAIIENQLEKIADEFASTATELSDTKATDILCEINFNNIDC